MFHYVPRVSCTENKQERKQQRQKREKKTQHEIKAGVLQWRLEIDRGGEMCGLSVGYCVGSVISGREWCIIIQNVKPAERSSEVNQMMEEPMILLFPSFAAPKSTPVKP